MSATPDPIAKVLRAWEKSAPGYDKQIALLEKIWFVGAANGLAPAYKAGSWRWLSAPDATCRTTRPMCR